MILPGYNRSWCIGRAIDSVLAQTYDNIELIVVDDGSTDDTRSVVGGYGDRVRLVALEHQGVYQARNHGLALARGEFIAFIDSDDYWLPDKLALQMPLMRRREVGLVFGDTIHVSAPRDNAPRTGNRSFRVSPPGRGRVAAELVWINFVPTSTVLVRRSCLDEISGFPQSQAIGADYPTWFMIALRHELDFVAEPVCEYTLHPLGISHDLGQSLAARIAVFSDVLDRVVDPGSRRLLRRLMFNLAVQLGIAAARGRAKTVSRPFSRMLSTAWQSGGLTSLWWTISFAAHHLTLRGKRLFS